MSRFKNFAHSLFSGYAQMAANVLFSFASVPLGLHYLSKSEFGLWALASQLAGYVALIDLGMSGAVSRILIDYKNERTSTDYGSVILTGALVNLVQGLVILLCGTALAFLLQDLLQIETDMRHEFLVLTIGQAVFLSGSFCVRIFGNVLIAHQRYDVGNYSQTVCFIANLATMWFCFVHGFGVYSLLWGQVAQQVLQTVAAAWWCFQLGLFPERHRWGRPTWLRFWELFNLGRDIFLYVLGGQLVNASQTILITRVLGLEASAVWAICTRPFTMVLQMLQRINDFSYAGLSEMLVQGDRARLLRRFKSLVVISSSMTVIASCMLALCNQPFILLWTQGKIGWPVINDLLLAVWMPVLVLVRLHTGFVKISKDFRALRYLYFLEGAFFIGGSLWLLGRTGITGMLGVSIVASLAFTLQYGLRITAEFFAIQITEPAFFWLVPAGRSLGAMVPVVVVAWLATIHAGPLMALVVRTGLGGVAGFWILWRWGLETGLKQEVKSRVTGFLNRRK